MPRQSKIDNLEIGKWEWTAENKCKTKISDKHNLMYINLHRGGGQFSKFISWTYPLLRDAA